MAKSNSFFNIDMLVLSLLKVSDCYGYELVKKIKEVSNNTLDIKEGTLYPVVHNLLKKEYISSRDEIVNKKVRVYYHIEPIGRDYLEKILKVYSTLLNMVRWKKMNKDSKKFIKYVKRIIPIHSKDKREFILLLTQRIKEFSDDLERCTYQDIVNEFGTPNEVAGSYIENMESNELIKKLNRKKLLKYFLSTLLILITLLWGFKMYRLNQLYEEAKSETHGYIAEEIIK
ncbi:DUF6120 family protein [Faecalibacillus intestinalis]|uniref:DUF6120 family protein n=1 Tax=Faecalibacillus intestinalis TaxID=1982626 RepID=UPI0022DF35BC|nr:DUF6120 family protein [Faecalibacillus intestinalis]